MSLKRIEVVTAYGAGDTLYYGYTAYSQNSSEVLAADSGFASMDEIRNEVEEHIGGQYYVVMRHDESDSASNVVPDSVSPFGEVSEEDDEGDPAPDSFSHDGDNTE